MSTKFDLNKFLQQPKLFTPIDYSGIVAPDLFGVQQTVDNLDKWRKSQGYRTNEEKLQEAQERASAAWAELGNSEDVYDWYNAHQPDPRKQAKFKEDGAKTAGLLMTIPLTVASAGIMGWIPALTSTATGFAGAYGGQKLGEAIDNKYGTNTAPWLSLAGGFAGGIGGYKGLVKAGSAGLLKGSGQMYGKQFIGDVASDFMNKKLSNPDLYKNILSQNLHNSHTNLTDNWSNLPPIKVSADDITDWNKLGVGENAEYLNQHLPLSPASELRITHPSLTVDPLVPDAIAENTGKLARFGSDKGKPIYKYYFPDGHGNVEIDGKLYHVGKSNRPKTNTLVHQNGSNNPIVYGKLQPILSKHPEEPTAIWWEQNTPYYGKQSTLPTFVIDDVVPSASARDVTRFGNSTSRLTDAVDLTDPKTNFKFFTYDSISGEMVQSPFVFPKQQSTKGSYALFERPSKLTLAERMGIPKGERNQPLNGHLKGGSAVQMFKEYGGIDVPENSKIWDDIQKLVPEARERYGLVGHTGITDDEIAKSLYKRAMGLNGKGNAAVWETGEPRLLFRGDTRRYNRLMDKWSPEKLAKGKGTMDNSLGNLFLGDISGKGQGVDRYFISGTDFFEPRIQGSATGARGKFGTIFDGGGEGIQGTVIPYIPKDAYELATYQTASGPYSLYKFPGKYSESGISDLNAFITRTPAMRDATGEISVLADDFIMKTKNYKGPNIDDYDGPTYDGVNSTVRNAMAKHYQSVLDDAQSKGQGLLFSEGLTDKYAKKFEGIHPFRREHEWYDYYALPNFNRQNAKHLFGWDLRRPVQWDVDNIYLEKGGKINPQQ